MPKLVTEFRCFLISPSDVAAERDVLSEATRRWNAQVGVRIRCRIELVRWESHGVPDLSDSPQGIINQQILEDCDIGVAVFWSRLGTATSGHASGSLEEIDKLRNAGKRIVVYFCDRPVPQERLRDSQFSELVKFRDRISKEGLVGRFVTEAELAENFYLHLTNIVTPRSASGRSSSSRTAAKPDSDRTGYVVPFEVADDFARAMTYAELEARGYKPARLDKYRTNNEDNYIRDFLHGGAADLFLVIRGEASPREVPEFYVPRKLVPYDDPRAFYIFVRLFALYQRPEYYIVPAKAVAERVEKDPGAPRYFTFQGITQDLTDMWYFRDPAGEFLEAWQLLGPPPDK